MIKIFNLFRNKSSMNIVAPVKGRVIDLSETPDKVFAEKMAGDGVAIDAIGDVFVSPCDGTLTMIFKTNHAFGIKTENGIEILVHIGIDTVQLNGDGFERLCEENAKVKAGTPIIKINRELIEKNGKSLITPVLITNMDSIKSLEPKVGIECIEGETIILEYRKK